MSLDEKLWNYIIVTLIIEIECLHIWILIQIYFNIKVKSCYEIFSNYYNVKNKVKEFNKYTNLKNKQVEKNLEGS